jgi:hypothetical protein
MEKLLTHLFVENGLIAAFAMVGAVIWVSYVLSKRLTFGRIHGSSPISAASSPGGRRDSPTCPSSPASG